MGVEARPRGSLAERDRPLGGPAWAEGPGPGHAATSWTERKHRRPRVVLLARPQPRKQKEKGGTFAESSPGGYPPMPVSPGAPGQSGLQTMPQAGPCCVEEVKAPPHGSLERLGCH